MIMFLIYYVNQTDVSFLCQLTIWILCGEDLPYSFMSVG